MQHGRFRFTNTLLMVHLQILQGRNTMSTFNNPLAEPKKTFLNNLIMLDFQITQILFIHHNYVTAASGLEAIIYMTGIQDKPEIKEAHDRITGPYTEVEIKQSFKIVQRYLNDKWFSELQLGMIPTSTLPTQNQMDIPKHDAIDPTQSSRI